MSSVNSVTRSANLSFSIENILKEDFPPKAKLKFPPYRYYLPVTSSYLVNSSFIAWVPFASSYRLLPCYYRHSMHLPSYQIIPVESNITIDGEMKRESEDPCSDHSNTANSAREVMLPDEGKEDEQTASNNCITNDRNEDKELQSRKRRNRSQFTKMQLEYLENYYSHNSYLSRDERTVLAQALDMTELQIRNWFQNKRYQKKMKIQK